MNIKLFFFTVISLLIAFPAKAANYQIGELIIDENTTITEYIAYIYQILVGVGSLIAVIMVVLAGISWMTSEGNPTKIDDAKRKIFNALLGVGILLGSSLIVQLINPSLNTFYTEEINCEEGIIVEVREGYERTKCISLTAPEINYDILGTKNEEKWNFPEGSLLNVYTYSEPNFKGERKVFDFFDTDTYSGDITGAKSIYFVRKSPGIYLYNETNFQLGSQQQSPLGTLDNYSYFESQINDNISSIYIVDNSSDIEASDYYKYSVVAFTEAGYRGRCALINNSINDLDSPVSENYTDKIGSNTISSIIINRLLDPKIENRGEVIFYSTTNCGRLGSIIDPTNQIKECRVDIKSTPTIGNLRDNCPNFEEGDEIMSFQINGTAGLVLSNTNISNGSTIIGGTSDTVCEYFSTRGSCVNLLSLWGSSIYTIKGEKPKSFIILPKD